MSPKESSTHHQDQHSNGMWSSPLFSLPAHLRRPSPAFTQPAESSPITIDAGWSDCQTGDADQPLQSSPAAVDTSLRGSLDRQRCEVSEPANCANAAVLQNQQEILGLRIADLNLETQAGILNYYQDCTPRYVKGSAAVKRMADVHELGKEGIRAGTVIRALWRSERTEFRGTKRGRRSEGSGDVDSSPRVEGSSKRHHLESEEDQSSTSEKDIVEADKLFVDEQTVLFEFGLHDARQQALPVA